MPMSGIKPQQRHNPQMLNYQQQQQSGVQMNPPPYGRTSAQSMQPGYGMVNSPIPGAYNSPQSGGGKPGMQQQAALQQQQQQMRSIPPQQSNAQQMRGGKSRFFSLCICAGFAGSKKFILKKLNCAKESFCSHLF